MRVLSVVAFALVVQVASALPASGFSSSPFGVKWRLAGRDFDLISEFPKFGARVTYVNVIWDEVQPGPGRWRWEELDHVVDTAGRVGVEVFFKVLTGGGWATTREGEGREGGGDDDDDDEKAKWSYPPRRMEDYTTFISTLVTHFKGRVRYFAIQNEINAPNHWRAGVTGYHSLLAAAYRAAKAADPEAIIVNHGPGSRTYGLVLAREMLEAGRPAEAISFYNRYYDLRHVPNLPQVQSEPELRRLVYGELGTRYWEVLRAEFRDGSRFYDVYQVHFYENWDLLAQVLTWIKAQMRANNATKPIEIWELGYKRRPDVYDPGRHPSDLVKLIATALGNGARRIVYLPLANDKAARGAKDLSWPLLDVNRRPTPALTAYATLAGKLEDMSRGEPVDLGKGVTAYRFNRSRGVLYILWSATPTDVRFPAAKDASVQVTDVAGRRQTMRGGEEGLKLAVSDAPLIIEGLP